MRSQAQKLTDDGARAEFLKCFSGAASNLHNLDAVEAATEEAALKAMVAQAEEETRGVCNKPWKQIPEVTRFQEQFQGDVILKRRRILVFDGPSQFGKTECALALVPPGKAVEINCANCLQEPPLQALYRPVQHDLVLLDECKVALLLKNKRLLQGPPAPVVLGSTQSNRFTYKAFLYKKRIVICSNTWAQELRRCKRKKDREWIRDNTIYYKVREPLWVED